MPNRIKGFDEVLKEALDDFVENGYDSAERLAYWQERLRRAAEESMTPEARMEEMLRDAMSDIFKRDVDRGAALARHPGVARFTLDKIKPQLRGELSKRIRASADLIKLDRARMINETLQRFGGWASSVPAGGTKSADKKGEKDTVRKSLAGLGFRERRVLIDQSHKLTAAIDNVIAVGGGAIAATWRSHYHQAGYDYREEHKEREIESKEKPYLVRGSWAAEAGLVKLSGSKWLDSMTQPGEEVFCRCYLVWKYNLSALPTDMLTAKGKARLAEARRKLAA